MQVSEESGKSIKNLCVCFVLFFFNFLLQFSYLQSTARVDSESCPLGNPEFSLKKNNRPLNWSRFRCEKLVSNEISRIE